MGKPTDLNQLKYSRFSVSPGVRPLKKDVVVKGFDTETGLDGNIIVIASSDGLFSFGDPYGNVLEFLTKPEFYNSFNYFYNLSFDHNALFKTVCDRREYTDLARYKSEEDLKDFIDLTACGRCLIGEYLIEYIHGKMLKIRRKGKTWKYWDISKFYKGGTTGRLVDVYRDVFKEEYSKLMDASVRFDVIDEDVVNYCIEDARACQRLAENLVIPANRIVPMRTWYSGATLAKNLRRKYLKGRYKFNNSKLQQYAMNAYGGARIEVFKRGCWGFKDNDSLYMYDIRSAYPSEQYKVTDVGAAFSERCEYLPDANHSFFRINVKIDDCIIGPLKYRFQNVIYYPQGMCSGIWVDKNELEMLMEFDVRFNIEKACHDVSRETYRPYEYLKDVYEERFRCKHSDDPAERQREFPLKLAANSSYGMLIERTAKRVFKEKFTFEEQDNEDNYLFKKGDRNVLAIASWNAGQFFNPVHACEVTSAIRCRIFRDAVEHEGHLVKYATDSITFDKRINLDIGDKLGQYEDSPRYRGIVVGSGIYSLYSERKKVLKFRSFDSADLALLAAENGDKAMIEICKKSPVKLKEARTERFRWFNTFQEKRKSMDINFDHRRVWFPERMRDMNELMRGHYDSIPLDFQALEKVGRIPAQSLVSQDDTFDRVAYLDSSLNAKENRANMENMIAANRVSR